MMIGPAFVFMVNRGPPIKKLNVLTGYLGIVDTAPLPLRSIGTKRAIYLLMKK